MNRSVSYETILGDSNLWSDLHDKAVAASKKAYAPYSNFPVGVAALCDSGEVLTGANVENASYGLGLCAECSLVSAITMCGAGKIVAAVCVNGVGEVLMPCGRCRQLLFEHSVPDMVLKTPAGFRTIQEILPQAFGPDDLNKYTNEGNVD